MRIGSLSLDQAGSVVSLFAAAYFFNSYVASMSPAYLIGLLGALAMIAGTTLASYLGAFRRDFVPGGESVLGSDVVAPERPAAKPSAAAASTEPEGFGASSAGASAASAGPAANRPGMPVTGKDEARREAAPVAVPERDAGLGAAAAPATSSAATSSAASAPASAAGATGSTAEKTDHAPFKKDSDRAPAPGTSTADTDAPEPGGKNPSASVEEDSIIRDSRAGVRAAAPNPGTAKAAEPDEVPGAAAAAGTDEATNALAKGPTGNHGVPGPDAAPGASAGTAGAVKDPDPETGSDAVNPGNEAPASGTGTDEPGAARKPEPVAPEQNQGRGPGSAREQDPAKDAGADAADAADAAGGPRKATGTAADAKPAKESASSAAEAADAESVVPAAGSPNPATMAVPRAGGDLKATAALSRTEIDAHRAAAERAKAEAESSFGARADVAAADPTPASFWFALNHPRPVFHPVKGNMLTTLNPGKWILCLEDRGTEYLINLAEGRPAVLRDLDDLQFPDN